MPGALACPGRDGSIAREGLGGYTVLHDVYELVYTHTQEVEMNRGGHVHNFSFLVGLSLFASTCL